MPQGWLSDIAEAGAHADHLGDLAQWVPSQAALLGILTAAAIAGIVLWLAGRIVLKPAIVFVRDGEARLVTRRETYDDLLATHRPAIDAAG